MNMTINRRSFLKKSALLLATVPFLGMINDKAKMLIKATPPIVPKKSAGNVILTHDELAKRALFDLKDHLYFSKEASTRLAKKVDDEALAIYKNAI